MSINTKIGSLPFVVTADGLWRFISQREAFLCGFCMRENEEENLVETWTERKTL